MIIYKCKLKGKKFYGINKSEIIKKIEKDLCVFYNEKEEIFEDESGIKYLTLIEENIFDYKMSKLEFKFLSDLIKRMKIKTMIIKNKKEGIKFLIENKIFYLFKKDNYWEIYNDYEKVIWKSTSLKKILNKLKKYIKFD